MPKLIVKVENLAVWSKTKLELRLDGNPCGKSDPDDQSDCIELVVAPGTHSIQAFVENASSEAIVFPAGEEEEILFDCCISGFPEKRVLLQQDARQRPRDPLPTSRTQIPGPSETGECSIPDWSIILGVADNASMAEIASRYVSLLSKFDAHEPAKLTSDERSAADREVELIHLAYETAKKKFQSR